MSPYLRAWLYAFVFTQAVEMPVYHFFLPCRVRAALLPSLLTHPIVWFVIFPYLDASHVAKVWLAEVFAVVVEALLGVWLLRRSLAERGSASRTSRGRVVARALVVAVVANAASLGLGLASRRLFGVP